MEGETFRNQSVKIKIIKFYHLKKIKLKNFNIQNIITKLYFKVGNTNFPLYSIENKAPYMSYIIF